MHLSKYQDLAYRTANKDLNGTEELIVSALGLTGEAGEVADHIKKHIGHGQPIDGEKLYKEVGDVLWYLALLCTNLGWDLGQVAEANIEKLRERWPEGFDLSSPNAAGDLGDRNA